MKKLLLILLLLIPVSVNALQCPTVSMAALSNDPNGVGEDQTTSGAATLLLNGALVAATDGFAIIGAAQQIAFEGSGNNGSVTATIIGTDADGNAQTEDLTLSNGSTATTVLYYKTVTFVTVDVAVTGNIEFGPLSTNGGVSPIFRPTASQVTIRVTVTGTQTYAVEYTLDPYGNTANIAWTTHPVLTGLTATQVSNILLPVTGIRVKTSSYTSGTVSMVTCT